MDPITTLLPALIPVMADGIRGLIARLTGGAGAQPQNVGEAIQLIEADVNKMRAMAELDRPGGAVSLWVANLRASARYLAVYLIFSYGFAVTVAGAEPVTVANAQQMMASAFFFLFGDRVYLGIRSRR